MIANGAVGIIREMALVNGCGILKRRNSGVADSLSARASFELRKLCWWYCKFGRFSCKNK